MSVLEELQTWYESQCGDNWEDEFGVVISTVDNPGWCVTIDLDRTKLASKPFAEIKDLDDQNSWIRCWVKGTKFEGVGGPQELEHIIRVFLDWANG